jgi:hypothetical protein
MPHFVESLADVKECSRTVFMTLQCFGYCICDTLDMFSSGVFLSETKLVIRYSPLFVEEWLKSSQEEFLK